MGIENLLGFLRPAFKPVHISQYRGQRAAVDAMAWLYKGCFSCSMELNLKVDTNDYLYFIQKMVNMLVEYKVVPVLIFDGLKLKAKERTDKMRKQLKKENLDKAQQLLAEGKTLEAKKFFQRSLNITKQMMYTTFDVLDKLKIEYMVSPYEADAQIAYLCKIGFCDFAITEDV